MLESNLSIRIALTQTVLTAVLSELTTLSTARRDLELRVEGSAAGITTNMREAVAHPVEGMVVVAAMAAVMVVGMEGVGMEADNNLVDMVVGDMVDSRVGNRVGSMEEAATGNREVMPNSRRRVSGGIGRRGMVL